MAAVHFAPYAAVKYTGTKATEFSISTARPKPTLKRGDIMIVDKRTAFNLTHKGFGNYEEVEEIKFIKADVQRKQELKAVTEKFEAVTAENHALFEKNVALVEELTALKGSMAAEKSMQKDDTTKQDGA